MPWPAVTSRTQRAPVAVLGLMPSRWQNASLLQGRLSKPVLTKQVLLRTATARPLHRVGGHAFFCPVTASDITTRRLPMAANDEERYSRRRASVQLGLVWARSR